MELPDKCPHGMNIALLLRIEARENPIKISHACYLRRGQEHGFESMVLNDIYSLVVCTHKECTYYSGEKVEFKG